MVGEHRLHARSQNRLVYVRVSERLRFTCLLAGECFESRTSRRRTFGQEWTVDKITKSWTGRPRSPRKPPFARYKSEAHVARQDMKIGYIIASAEVVEARNPIRYLYREAPDNPLDSGWRVFAGTEDQSFADDPGNFAMYNASTIVAWHPDIAPLLAYEQPAAFERERDGGPFVAVGSPADED